MHFNQSKVTDRNGNASVYIWFCILLFCLLSLWWGWRRGLVQLLERDEVTVERRGMGFGFVYAFYAKWSQCDEETFLAMIPLKCTVGVVPFMETSAASACRTASFLFLLAASLSSLPFLVIIAESCLASFCFRSCLRRASFRPWFSSPISRFRASTNYCSILLTCAFHLVWKISNMFCKFFLRFTKLSIISVAAEHWSFLGRPCSCNNMSRESISLYFGEVAASLTARDIYRLLAFDRRTNSEFSSSGSLRTMTWWPKNILSGLEDNPD